MKKIEIRFSRELFDSLLNENYTDLEAELVKINIKEMMLAHWAELDEVVVSIEKENGDSFDDYPSRN